MTKLFSILLFFTLSASAQDPRQKLLIDTSKIRSVEILKENLYPKIGSTIKVLTQKQYIGFAQKWNLAKELGADKYRSNYSVYVLLKNGGKRQFSIRGSKIQESSTSWSTYDMIDKQYFDKIWTAIK